MTVTEFWTRLAINAVITIAGIALLASGLALGGIIAAIGVIAAIWTVFKAQKQVRDMDRAVAEKRARQSVSS